MGADTEGQTEGAQHSSLLPSLALHWLWGVEKEQWAGRVGAKLQPRSLLCEPGSAVSCTAGLASRVFMAFPPFLRCCEVRGSRLTERVQTGETQRPVF